MFFLKSGSVSVVHAELTSEVKGQKNPEEQQTVRQRHVGQTRCPAGGSQPVSDPHVLLSVLLSVPPARPAHRRLLRDQDPVRGREPAPAAGRDVSQQVCAETPVHREVQPGPPDRRHQAREPVPHGQEHPQDPETQRAGPD